MYLNLGIGELRNEGYAQCHYLMNSGGFPVQLDTYCSLDLIDMAHCSVNLVSVVAFTAFIFFILFRNSPSFSPRLDDYIGLDC